MTPQQATRRLRRMRHRLVRAAGNADLLLDRILAEPRPMRRALDAELVRRARHRQRFAV